MQLNADPDSLTDGMVQGGAIYASANFPDADGNDTRPFPSLVNTVAHVSLYHLADGSDKQNANKLWKRKIRDIMQNHQEQILQFFTKPIPDQHPLKSAQLILQRFGKPINSNSFDYSRSPPTIFKDCIQDLSGRGIIEINKYISDLEKLLIKLKNEGKRVAGLGASTKGNVFLQALGSEALSAIDQIGEVNSFKFGKVTPGTRIPIRSETEVLESSPDYILVLPWHFKDSFDARLRGFVSGGGKVIYPLPELVIVE